MDQLKLLNVLSQIQDMCIGEITMGYSLDANHIGSLISEATGMSAPEFNKYITEFAEDYPGI